MNIFNVKIVLYRGHNSNHRIFKMVKRRRMENRMYDSAIRTEYIARSFKSGGNSHIYMCPCSDAKCAGWGLTYLDVIFRANLIFDVPIAAYNVSGEYSMLVAASQKGWIDREKAMIEMLLSIRRAGANMILTYFAKEAAAFLRADYGSYSWKIHLQLEMQK